MSDDPLGPVKGIVVGLALMGIVWAVIAAAVWCAVR